MRAARQVRRGQVAIYHVTCRTVGGEYLLARWQSREAFRRRMYKLAKFLGICPCLSRS